MSVAPERPRPRDPALMALLAKVGRARGVACAEYKESCLRRRLAVRMRARGVHNFDEYSAVLDDDPGEYERLLDTLTINVTSFYRNPETWAVMAARVLPELWRQRGPELRAWSAGCSSGEEPYTLAMLWLDQAGLNGRRVPDAIIDATDLDRTMIGRAEAGSYPRKAMTDLPEELVQRYFTGADPLTIAPAVRRLVRFRPHDLTREAVPRSPLDLIVCRNVVIYFDRPLQERLYGLFADALPADGILVLGKVETLLGPARSAFRLLDTRERVYRRV